MSSERKGWNGPLREWLSKKIHFNQDLKSEKHKKRTSAPVRNAVEKAPSIGSHPKEEFNNICSTDDQDKEVMKVELSEELMGLLRGNQYELLCAHLRNNNITTIDQFKSLHLWPFLNVHDIYSLPERLSVFEYLQEQLHPELITEPKKAIDEKSEMGNKSSDNTVSDCVNNLVEMDRPIVSIMKGYAGNADPI